MRCSLCKVGILIFVTGVLFACSGNIDTKPRLFSVDSLLSAQAGYLAEHGVILKKSTSLGDAREEVSLTPKDAAAWKKELEIFAALEVINKPLNRDAYHLESLSDEKSNLLVKSITTSADLPVRYLKVYYHNTPEKVRKIEAEYQEANSLYRSVRILKMEFQEVGEVPAITSYSIEGGQKMFLGDSVRYVISGALAIPK